MKKLIGILALIGIVTFTFIGCEKKQQNVDNDSNNSQVQQENTDLNNNSGEITTEPLNREFKIDETLANIIKVSGLDESSKMSEDKVKSEYDFGQYEGLQKEVRSQITEDSITEIAIVKIGENEQTQDLFQIVFKRIAQLQQKYAENDKINSILNNGDNIVIKQQGGVLIVIIAENAKEIEQKIDEQM